LNVKYVIQRDNEGRSYAALNREANGNAWFVSTLKEVKTANDEILALNDINLKKEAVVNTSKFTNLNRLNFRVDSLSTISLSDYEPNHLTYKTSNSNAGIAVFSEMHYPHGWNAYVDGNLQDHFKANYILRALRVPAGTHTIEFKFEPEVVQNGSKITLASSIVMGLIVLSGLGFTFWRSRKVEKIKE